MEFLEGLLAPVRASAEVYIEVPALMTLPGVDIMAAGEWNLSTGKASFTPDDLASAVEAATCPAVGDPVIKIGHIDPRFNGPEYDGEPALGHVTDMQLTAGGNVITGDLTGMPGWLAEVAPSAYPQRSIEGAYNVKCQIGHLHEFVITGLALLGVTPPGIGVLGGLGDLATLFGVNATHRTFTAQTMWATTGGNMPDKKGGPPQAAVSTDDIRKAYYGTDGVPLAYWICEMQLDPPQLIVCDESTDDVYRVPFTIKGAVISFADPVAVEIEYKDVAATRGKSGQVIVFASAADSRSGITPPEVMAAWSAATQVKNLGDSPTAAALKAMFALPGATKSASKLPHHDVSTAGAVGAANPGGVTAAIGAINGAQGGVKGVGAAALKAAYNHLAAHDRSAGNEPPPYSGPAASVADRLTWLRQVHAALTAADTNESVTELAAALDATLDQASALAGQTGAETPGTAQVMDLVTAAEALADQLMEGVAAADGGAQTEPGNQGDTEGPTHGAYSGTHTHMHTANGTQGADDTHDHSHTHSGDGNHGHTHAGAGPTTRRGDGDVQFTAEQETAIRAALGLAEDEEITAEHVMAMAVKAAAPPVAAKGGRLPAGAVVLDQAEFDRMKADITKGERAHERMLTDDRERELAAAVQAGKFAVSRIDHWRRVYTADPEGTKMLLGSLQRGSVPTEDIGSAGGLADEEFDREYSSMFPPAGPHSYRAER